MTLKEPTEAALRRDLSATVHALALPEGRRVGQPGHERAKKHLIQRLKKMGCLPYQGNFFLSCGRWQHYHEPSDTPDRLDYRKMAKITRYAEKLVEGISQSGKLTKVRTKVNTIELEITHLQQTLGPLLPLLLGKLEKKSLKTRSDLDALAGLLLEEGL